MKKVSLFLAVGIMAISTSLTSCKKGCTDPAAANFNKDVKKDDKSCAYPEATLTISNPTESQMYNLGDTIKINGTAAHYQELQGWSLYILNKTSEDTVLKNSNYTVGKNLTITSSWVNNVIAHSDMELGVTVTVNKNTVKKQIVNFHCMP
ncbi:MAG: hypothetical protein ABI207_01490 [Crocinitomicaceae bacterium]